MLFINFTGEHLDAFKSKFKDVATAYRGKGVSFLLGDLEASQGVLQVSFCPSHMHLASCYCILTSHSHTQLLFLFGKVLWT